MDGYRKQFSARMLFISIFVGYHFDHLQHWWAYVWLAIAGVIVSVMAVREGIKKAAADPDKP